MPEGTFLPQEAIRRKRDGETLAPAEIDAMIAGAVSGHVSGEQVAAFLMAAFLRGLDQAETVRLTEAMMRSGMCLTWDDLPGPVVDKHSTGGVGDNVSLMLAPAVAACGGFVPMISGRGLGHTGGTLDKLESIPGYNVGPAIDRFRAIVRDVGCAIVGQTADLAPADRLLYGIRDVTATVESIPLITASILSKKLAAGLRFLVMDVKTGNGAFMPEHEKARALAKSLVAVADGAGLPTSALITAMDEPLASAAGNALEIRNAVDFLTGRRRDPRLHDVVLALGAEMLRLSGLAATADEGRQRVAACLDNGRAAERFERMVVALGGTGDVLRRPEAVLPQAPVIHPVPAPRPGIIAAVDTRAIGMAVVALGGGRTRPSQSIDPRVGFSDLPGIGTRLEPGMPLGFVHAASEEAAQVAARQLAIAYTIADAALPARPPVIEMLQA